MGRPLEDGEGVGSFEGKAASVPVLLHDHDFSGHLADGSREDFDEYEAPDGHDPLEERTVFWESQEALLQEILEGGSSTGLRLREEISEIVKLAKGTELCSCKKQGNGGCFHCLRRRVVRMLCDKGFDASVCVSKWKRTSKFPGGTHEYIEVIVTTQGRKKQVRVLIELEFRDQFSIAKACEEYRKLVSLLPEYYVGKVEYLYAMVGVLCDAAKRSMKEKKLHMGPWRKRSFMQMKWSNIPEKRRFQDKQFESLASTPAEDVTSSGLSTAPTLIAI